MSRGPWRFTLALLLTATIAACTGTSSPPADVAGEGTPVPVPVPSRAPVPRPDPGHEVYGYVPYWEMDDGIAEHLASTPLTTLALFSVTNAPDGSISETATGYDRVTGPRGRRIAAEARERGVRVELTFTSFGLERNERFLGDREIQDTTIAALVELIGAMGVNGVNVDIEGMSPILLQDYGAFVGRLRAAAVAADPDDQVSVATGANALGAAMAKSATDAGADRVFVMGYDYRTAGSEPGATAPLDRADGDGRTLRTTLDAYEALGVPLERAILGLPLYGITWPVAGPVLGALRTGRGEAWIPRRHRALFQNPDAVPIRDALEAVDVYFVADDGTVAHPTVDGAGVTADGRTWHVIYIDAADTLEQKLALANARGLAGGGFWALGYERGRPEVTQLIVRFVGGENMSDG